MRPIDADALAESFRESISRCEEWIKNADEEIKPRAKQAMAAFIECLIRLKEEPTVGTADEDTGIPDIYLCRAETNPNYKSANSFCDVGTRKENN